MKKRRLYVKGCGQGATIDAGKYFFDKNKKPERRGGLIPNRRNIIPCAAFLFDAYLGHGIFRRVMRFSVSLIWVSSDEQKELFNWGT